MLQVREGGQEKFFTPDPRDVQVLQAEIFSSQRFENFLPKIKVCTYSTITLFSA